MNQQGLGFLFADISRLMRKRFQQQLEGSSLTLAQARALIYVSRHQGVRQVTLADFLELQPITLTRLLDQLAAAGLIERRADPQDRRAHRIYLTPAATPQLAAIHEVTTTIRGQALEGLSGEQIDTLIVALHQMRDNLCCRNSATTDSQEQ